MTPAEHLLSIVDGAKPQRYEPDWPIYQDWLAARRLAEAVPEMVAVLGRTQQYLFDGCQPGEHVPTVLKEIEALLRKLRTPNPEPQNDPSRTPPGHR